MPKFHAELAGKGVEYSWAHAKSCNHQVPVTQKQNRENFKELVREGTCPLNVLNKVRIQNFAARARANICIYHHLDQATRLEEHNSDAASPDTSAILTHHSNKYFCTPRLRGSWKPLKGIFVPLILTVALWICSWRKQQKQTMICCDDDRGGSSISERNGIYSRILYTYYELYSGVLYSRTVGHETFCFIYIQSTVPGTWNSKRTYSEYHVLSKPDSGTVLGTSTW